MVLVNVRRSPVIEQSLPKHLSNIDSIVALALSDMHVLQIFSKQISIFGPISFALPGAGGFIERILLSR